MSPNPPRKRIILLSSSLSYRAGPFLAAAHALDLDIVQGLDMPPPLAEYWQPTLPVDFKAPAKAAQDIFQFAGHGPVDAIVPVDDGATVIAALASELLDLSHNAPGAAYAARNKLRMRELLASAGVPSPKFEVFASDADASKLAQAVRYPCVVKPLMLSGSQGVIRADNPEEFVRAFNRTRAIVSCYRRRDGRGAWTASISWWRIIMPGVEVVLEGILAAGQLMVLALFDKPDPLDGPFFEETIYVTPSRLPDDVQTLDRRVRGAGLCGAGFARRAGARRAAR